MKLHAPHGLLAWIFLLGISQGCGPFFADTVLDKPQAALDVPPVSYLHDIYQLAGIPTPEAESFHGQGDRSFVRQIPFETAELRQFWEGAGIDAAEIERRLTHYEFIREKLLAPISEAGPMDFPTHKGQPLPIPARPLGEDFPVDVADYVEGARLHASGDTVSAREIWKGILDRPPAERKLRAAWAAWMLAKTSPNEQECMEWYARVESEIQSGASDAIHLRGAAKAWRASKMSDDPVSAIHFHFDALVGGKTSSIVDLRMLSGKILATGDAALFATAAADPLIRHLINLDLHASLDGPRQWNIDTSLPEIPSPIPAGWLAALEALPGLPLDDGARIAWSLYSVGRFDESRKWLELSVKADPLAIWLQAKFDLRDGNLEMANQHLAEAVALQTGDREWKPENPVIQSRWESDANERIPASQGRLLADLGIVALARRDYLPALEALRMGGYREDAVYLAESVISTDGLVRHVRKVAPQWMAGENEQAPVNPFTFLQTQENHTLRVTGTDNQLRYVLARRLARERRFKEAREFMPPQLVPLLDHYSALDRARRSGRYSGEALAAITWRQARFQRHLGAELFSTDGAPDGGARGWDFAIPQFSKIRAMRDGWSMDWSRQPMYLPAEKAMDMAIPKVTADEISRTQRYQVKQMRRFHYRYTAADLAWEAAKSLPANHALLPFLYNTAGQWLAATDPTASDRFYQAMVRRCAKTPEGQAADEKRWFLPELADLADLQSLPAEFMGP